MDCSELQRTLQENLGQQGEASSDFDVSGFDLDGIDNFFLCTACKKETPLHKLWDQDANELVDICKDCRCALLAADEGDCIRFFSDTDQHIYCQQCENFHPGSSFPPGIGSDGVSICCACQETIDHMQMQQCAGVCGRFVGPSSSPCSEQIILCENCKKSELSGTMP